MDGFLGLGLAFAFGAGLVTLVPAGFILTVAFVYVRQHRGQPVDINTGVSAYTVILIGLGALLITLGVAQMLTAILAEIDADYTYGAQSVGGGDIFGGQDGLGSQTADDRQERNVAAGFALFVTGALVVGAHIWLRGWLGGDARFDRGVEGAWDTLLALIIGVVAVILFGQMLTETFGRAITDDNASAAGSTIAQLIAVASLWVVYLYRSLTHTGLLVRDDLEGGPHGGEEL